MDTGSLYEPTATRQSLEVDKEDNSAPTSRTSQTPPPTTEVIEKEVVVETTPKVLSVELDAAQESGDGLLVLPSTPIDDSEDRIPTGNFGDIFAGYVAKKMGLPIKKLLLATNENNILTRFINGGDYSLGNVVQTVSPSMDIQVASNFERYLYYLFNEDPAQVRGAFTAFATNGRMTFTDAEMARVKDDFISTSVTEQQTLATIADFREKTGYLLDPHTAVGVYAALLCTGKGETPVCLATAHPAKFGEAVERATGFAPPYPEALAGIEKLPTRCAVLDADQAAIREFIEEKAL